MVVDGHLMEIDSLASGVHPLGDGKGVPSRASLGTQQTTPSHLKMDMGVSGYPEPPDQIAGPVSVLTEHNPQSDLGLGV